MKKSASLLALGIAANALLSTAAAASEQTFRIDANSTSSIDLSVCSSSVYMVANGDDDTDLDFWLYDNNGNLLHSDTDSTDITFFTIENYAAGGGRCLPYRLEVSNLGGVYNNMVLSLTDQGPTSGADVKKGTGGGPANRESTLSVRIDANSDHDLTLTLCAPAVSLAARGDGDTDLDFWIYDEKGNQVHSDTDSTDITFATLYNGRAVGSCADFRMRVHNFGNVYNQLQVTLTEQ